MRFHTLTALPLIQLAMAALPGIADAEIIHRRFTNLPQFRLYQSIHIAIGSGEVSAAPGPADLPQLAIEGRVKSMPQEISSFAYLMASVTPSGMISPTLVEAGTLIREGVLTIQKAPIRRPPFKQYKTYLGFSFLNDGKINYGWLAVNVSGGPSMSPRMLVLESMAYENSGAPITAGAMPASATALSISQAGELSWLSAPNLTYRLEVSTDCASWTDSGVSARGTGGIIRTAAPVQGPKSFYRLRVGVR